jgi:hypothetical protein
MGALAFKNASQSDYPNRYDFKGYLYRKGIWDPEVTGLVRMIADSRSTAFGCGEGMAYLGE